MVVPLVWPYSALECFCPCFWLYRANRALIQTSYRRNRQNWAQFAKCLFEDFLYRCQIRWSSVYYYLRHLDWLEKSLQYPWLYSPRIFCGCFWFFWFLSFERWDYQILSFILTKSWDARVTLHFRVYVEP